MKIPRYEMILWWSDEDGAFVVDVPELPGCMAHGATRAAVIENAESAIAFCSRPPRPTESPSRSPKAVCWLRNHSRPVGAQALGLGSVGCKDVL